MTTGFDLFSELDLFQGEDHQPYHFEGGENAALLIHGFPGTAAETRPLATILHEAGWTTRGLLLPGFGPGIASLADRSAEEWLAVVVEETAELKRRFRRVVLIGFSMGGALALQAAARTPVDGLALLAPFWKVDSRLFGVLWPVVSRVFPRFKPFGIIKPDFDDPELRRGIEQFMPGMDLDDPEVREAMLSFEAPMSMLRQVIGAGRAAYAATPAIPPTPALILQGRSDELVRPHCTRQMMARLSGPLHYYELDSGHDLLRPDLPAWPHVRALVTQFASRLAGDRQTLPVTEQSGVAATVYPFGVPGNATAGATT